MAHRLAVRTFAEIDIGEVVEGVGVLRIERDRAKQMRPRGAQVVARVQQVGEIVVGFGKFRIDRQGLL